MTIEYVLLCVVIFLFAIKVFTSAPQQAFMNSGPRLGARVENQLLTGRPFAQSYGVIWQSDQK